VHEHVAPAHDHDVVFVIADGLSARAVQVHAQPLLANILPMLPTPEWTLAPLVLARRGRGSDEAVDPAGECFGLISALVEAVAHIGREVVTCGAGA
jgi:ethanolamine ammonia-lyase small subunit